MIYIFDDRTQRRKDNEDKLKEFHNLIKFETVNTIPGKSVEESIIDSLENLPECIIFHKSYVFSDQNVKFENIHKLFTSFNIPIVIFSGGTEGSNKGAEGISMNADLMYENMRYFLENYKEKNEINIDALLWGKRYKLNAILQFQNELSKEFFINNDFNKHIDDTEEVTIFIKDNLKRIDERLGNDIISEIDKNSNLTLLDLANIIDDYVHNFK